MVVRRRFLSPPLLVFDPRLFYFGRLVFLRRLGYIFIVFMGRLIVFPFILLFDFVLDLLLQPPILIILLPFSLLLPAFGLLHLYAKLLLVLILFSGLAFCLLGVHDEQPASEGLIVSHGYF